MNKRLDLTNLGGMPFTQYTLKYMQDSYRGAFAAMAKMIGDNAILYGCVVTGANVSSGWISYNGELLPFIGGVLGSGDIAIAETPDPRTFDDANIHDVYFEKLAILGTPATFNFSSLKSMPSLVNIWQPGDIKEKYCDQNYINNNFDVNGYGLNSEVGWRILGKALPDTLGKVMINYDPNDTDFDTIGNKGGGKQHTLSSSEQGTFEVKAKSDDLINASGGGGSAHVRLKFNNVEIPDGTANGGAFGNALTVSLSNAATPHNVMNPFYVILKLIKL